MEELVQTFHIDWKLLIAQLINFGIVLAVLYFFALKPLLKIMNKRSSDIEQSLTDAKRIEEQLKSAEVEKEKIVTEAKKEAQIIAAQAVAEAEKIREAKVHQTREEMERMTERAKQEIASEKDQMLKEAKQELADLVVTASAKVIGKELDAKTHHTLIQNTITHASDKHV
ncbi:MAG: F0F1 ATP synthase subunit B [Candidatus Kerfeldbacteria bacterium]|nr:F0F1 ATP synthase subunit B [Candidatus Kerfeldbacteria bacterium]